MPFHTNNVDLTVNANSLFGLNSLLITLPEAEARKLFDAELRDLHKNVTSLLIYGIESGIVQNRPDLALVYYPSNYDFYWFVTRNIHALRTAKLEGRIHFKELEECLEKLEITMMKEGVEQLMNLSDRKTKGLISWEGFLGNFANVTRNEDRMFSTAVTLNTLIDLFTVTKEVNDKKSREWVKHASAEIKTVIYEATAFLAIAAEMPDVSKLNAFFSGSIKGFTSLPYFYPANYDVFKNNGTKIDSATASASVINDQLIHAFLGTVEKEEYEKMLSHTWFGVDTPTEF